MVGSLVLTDIVKKPHRSSLGVSECPLFKLKTPDSNLIHNLLELLNHLKVPKVAVLLRGSEGQRRLGAFRGGVANEVQWSWSASLYP